jgi:plastocyanin domain-containing protein
MSAKTSLLRTAILTLALGALAAACGNKTSDAGPAQTGGAAAPAGEGRRVDVAVTADGYTPSTIEAKKGESLVLRFTRTVKGECLAQVVFPEQKITKDLPLNTPVEIAIKAEKAGKIPFQCGMNMVKGSINVTGS